MTLLSRLLDSDVQRGPLGLSIRGRRSMCGPLARRNRWLEIVDRGTRTHGHPATRSPLHSLPLPPSIPPPPSAADVPKTHSQKLPVSPRHHIHPPTTPRHTTERQRNTTPKRTPRRGCTGTTAAVIEGEVRGVRRAGMGDGLPSDVWALGGVSAMRCGGKRGYLLRRLCNGWLGR